MINPLFKIGPLSSTKMATTTTTTSAKMLALAFHRSSVAKVEQASKVLGRVDPLFSFLTPKEAMDQPISTQ
jgi:hypothetical protein